MSDLLRSYVYDLKRNSEKERERELKEAELKRLENEHRGEERKRLDSGFLIEPTGLNFEKKIESKAKQDDAPAIEIVSQSKQSKVRTRKTNLVRAIESAAFKLHSRLGKKPSLDELWRYFETLQDETGFIEDFTDTHLTWRDTKGSYKDSPKSTVANHLSRIKI